MEQYYKINFVIQYIYIYIYKMKAMNKREIKKPYQVIIKPSVKEKAHRKAKKQQTSLSQVVENLLEEYSK